MCERFNVVQCWGALNPPKEDKAINQEEDLVSEQYAKMAEDLIAGKVDSVVAITKELLAAGVSASAVLSEGLLPGMNVVGQRFKACDMFIPEVLRSAKAMAGSMDLIRPLLAEAEETSAKTFVIGTVKGDLHDIGKNLVGMLFEGAGFRVVDLGIDLEPQVFVDAVKREKPDLLGLSALLTTTMPRMGEAISALKEAGLRDQVKIMVGGAPVTAEYAEQIGADAYGANAAMAVEKGKELVGM
jgi:corrinoid protein of di/trimethylamine methyltransferase